MQFNLISIPPALMAIGREMNYRASSGNINMNLLGQALASNNIMQLASILDGSGFLEQRLQRAMQTSAGSTSGTSTSSDPGPSSPPDHFDDCINRKMGEKNFVEQCEFWAGCPATWLWLVGSCLYETGGAGVIQTGSLSRGTNSLADIRTAAIGALQILRSASLSRAQLQFYSRSTSNQYPLIY